MCGKQNSSRGFGEKSVWGICVAAMVAALAMSSVGSPAWADAVIDVADLEVDDTGDSITSSIMVNGVTNLGAGTIYVDFDSSVVDVTGVAVGDVSSVTWSADTVVGGDIRQLIVVGVNASSGLTGDIVFANVTYQAVGSPGDYSVLDLADDSNMMDYDEYFQITHTLDDGSFAIAPEPVTLDIIDNGCPGTGLHRYTLRATGTGITTLSKFIIDGAVHQVFESEGTQSDWRGDESASELETTDSHVIFGELRLPDLGGETWPGPGEQPDKFTLETITGGGLVGMGTLNNYDESTGSFDAYLKLGEPSVEEETVELMQIVVADGGGFSIDLTMLTATNYNSSTGESTVTTHDGLNFTLDPLTAGDANGDGYVDATDVSILAQHWLQQSGDICWADGDFNRDGAVNDTDAAILAANWQPQSASVPEPCTLVLLASLAVAGVMVLWRRRV